MNTQEVITEQQAFEFESGKTGLIGSFIVQWFPAYFVWRTTLRYKRYLGFMKYKEIEKARKDKWMTDVIKSFKR